jgi:multisubunit Na+/H+ antiporter MnhG subunit
VALGALFILLGWIGVSGEPDVARQMSYLASGGIGGLTAAVVGVGLLISEDLRSDRRRLGRIEATLLDVSETVGRASKATSGRRR